MKVLTGILRHFAMTLLQANAKSQSIPIIRQRQSFARVINLRTNGNVVCPSSFTLRKKHMLSACRDGSFLAQKDGDERKKSNPLSDPAMMDGMFNMMKNNAAMMIPQTLIMSWINAFFSGFVISKHRNILAIQH